MKKTYNRMGMGDHVPLPPEVSKRTLSGTKGSEGEMLLLLLVLPLPDPSTAPIRRQFLVGADANERGEFGVRKGA